MIFTVRTTTGRENVVIDTLTTNIKNKKIPIKSVFHTDDLRGYIFVEGDKEHIEEAIRGIPHVRGIIPKEVKIEELEKFLVPEKREIKPELGDIVEVVGGPFKGEKAKITRIDETKNEATIQLLEAVIPIPVTISLAAIRIHEKKKNE